MADSLAPRLPQVLVTKAMAEVGEAAAQGQMPPVSTMELLRELTRVAPLETEPLLVKAAITQKIGNLARAEQLLLEARRRSPRSSAARYLLAQVWLSEGRIEDGLSEMAILSRMLPGSTAQLAPALSQYARMPGAIARLSRMLQKNPQLEQPLLNALATDPDNLPLILELDRAVRTSARRLPPEWQATVLQGLVNRGDFDRAYALWKGLAGYSGPRQLIFNPGFRPEMAPPPFNWTFNSSSAGVVEPGDGRMRVLYYGRDNTVLASQLLLLPAGSYNFSVGLSGDAAPGALRWVLHCLPNKTSLMQLELSSSATQARFQVPASGCDAQVLQLRGMAQDMPKESDVLVGPAVIERSQR